MTNEMVYRANAARIDLFSSLSLCLFNRRNSIREKMRNKKKEKRNTKAVLLSTWRLCHTTKPSERFKRSLVADLVFAVDGVHQVNDHRLVLVHVLEYLLILGIVAVKPGEKSLPGEVTSWIVQKIIVKVQPLALLQPIGDLL